VSGRKTAGGLLTVGAGDDLVVNGVIEADGETVGGNVDLAAASLVVLTPRTRVFSEADAGGFVTITGASAIVQPGADLEVDGNAAGGEVRITATGGDLVLSGEFRARGDSGGVIQGVATGNVTADGDFQSRTAGCTALSAGGSLDTTQGSFDGPIADSCD
jgi:hypothetical protein